MDDAGAVRLDVVRLWTILARGIGVGAVLVGALAWPAAARGAWPLLAAALLAVTSFVLLGAVRPLIGGALLVAAASLLSAAARTLAHGPALAPMQWPVLVAGLFFLGVAWATPPPAPSTPEPIDTSVRQ